LAGTRIVVAAFRVVLDVEVVLWTFEVAVVVIGGVVGVGVVDVVVRLVVVATGRFDVAVVVVVVDVVVVDVVNRALAAFFGGSIIEVEGVDGALEEERDGIVVLEVETGSVVDVEVSTVVDSSEVSITFDFGTLFGLSVLFAFGTIFGLVFVTLATLGGGFWILGAALFERKVSSFDVSL